MYHHSITNISTYIIFLHLNKYRSHKSTHKVHLHHLKHIFLSLVQSYLSVQQIISAIQVYELYIMYHHSITKISTYLILLYHHQSKSYKINQRMNLHQQNHIFVLVVSSYSLVGQFRSSIQLCELYSIYHHSITNISTYLIFLHLHQCRSYQSNHQLHLYHRNQIFISVVR